MSGSARNTANSAYAITRRIFQYRPLWTVGCMNFRLPSADRLYSRSSSGATSNRCPCRADDESAAWASPTPALSRSPWVTSAPRDRLCGNHLALGRARPGRVRSLEAPDVRHEGSNLVRLQRTSPGRHALGRPPLGHGLEDLLHRTAVDPMVVGEVGTNQPLGMLAVARCARAGEARGPHLQDGGISGAGQEVGGGRGDQRMRVEVRLHAGQAPTASPRGTPPPSILRRS